MTGAMRFTHGGTEFLRMVVRGLATYLSYCWAVALQHPLRAPRSEQGPPGSYVSQT